MDLVTLLISQDNDGVYDGNEIQGCTDPVAFNYDSPTTDTANIFVYTLLI